MTNAINIKQKAIAQTFCTLFTICSEINVSFKHDTTNLRSSIKQSCEQG